MSPSEKSKMARRFFLVGTIVAALLVFCEFASLENVITAIGSNLLCLFFAISILPSLGVPNCPLMIIGGGAAATVHGSSTTVLVAVCAVITNLIFSYWIAAYPLRSFLRKWIAQKARMSWLTTMESKSVLRATLALHLTPGVPLFIQTYFPGIHRLSYWKYLLIAVPIQSLYTAAIVLSSGEILQAIPTGTLTITLGTVALILVVRHSVFCTRLE